MGEAAMRFIMKFFGSPLVVSVCLLLGVSLTADVSRKVGHWAFRSVRSTTPPEMVSQGGVHPVDAFVLARLERRGLSLSPEASRETLIRRLTIDLHGIPSLPEEVERFVADSRPDAYERLIDRLLASPRYGERWARHWLDLVRYSESDGFKTDAIRPFAWRYRDYVIRALNADKPYDRFITEQLAGDEITPVTGDALVATGFLRLWAWECNNRVLPLLWQRILNDVTDVTGQTFLGLTVACARCHDHKIDPISRKDYHALMAFFAGMGPHDDLPVGTTAEIDDYHRALRVWEDETRELRSEVESFKRPYFRQAQRDGAKKFPESVQRIVAKPPEERSDWEKQIMLIGGPELMVSQGELESVMPKDVREKWDALKERLAVFEKRRPKFPLARGVRDMSASPPPTRISDDPSAMVVEPGVLPVLGESAISVEALPRSSGRRTTLARWIASRANPLTSRVLVNRLWQHHFGRGLVATPSDFGLQVQPPTHPELLDWLSNEFVSRGWSLKSMHRLILTSATYRQSVSHENPLGSSVDPDNRLLWRQNMRRVEAEVLRDSVLATSGDLDFRMYGESVYPRLPEGLNAQYVWKPTAELAERDRRSVYLVVKRNMHLPLLKAFDVPDNHGSCARRQVTTTAPQALMLLNGQWTLKKARAFAGRLLTECAEGGDYGRFVIDRAYRLVYGRGPTARETKMAREFLDAQAAIIDERIAGESVALPPRIPKGVEPAWAAALVDYCHSLWNTNEFIYVD